MIPGLQIAVKAADTTSPTRVETAPARFPRGPVIGWRCLTGASEPGVPSVADLPHLRLTSSGRASLYGALGLMNLPQGSAVLVPTYHCPTMIAPVVRAGLQPVFFAIGADGLPLLDSITAQQRERARAMIVAHYFGLPRSLQHIRTWCDETGISLIEDCAHSLIGSADGSPVGIWGRYATASISKFLPVPELGLLASREGPLGPDALSPPHWAAQLKGAIDVLESVCVFGRPAGLSLALRAVFGLKNRRRALSGSSRSPAVQQATESPDILTICDMSRIDQAPLALSRWIYRSLPLSRVVTQRQHNFDLYSRLLTDLRGARCIAQTRGADTAPYVYPLWVEDGDSVYHQLRRLGMPVFRWDRVWPGTPAASHDEGPRWSRHLLQLLCHQDLDASDIARVAAAVRLAVSGSGR